MINRDSRKNLPKHNKTPSLRDLMLGKKTVKELPENFFEKVLELEIKLKKGFSMDVLQELVSYYKGAIEYYSSIEDPRSKEYQSSLKILLSQPEIVKSMNKLNKKKSEEGTSGKSYNKERKESYIKDIKNKLNNVNYTVNREDQIKKFMKEAEKPEEKNKVENILCKDMNSQGENFRKRLEEKRKKTLLSTSDLGEINESRYRRGVSRDVSNFGGNKSFVIEGPKSDIGENENGLNLSFTGNNYNAHNDDTGLHNNFLQDLENSLDKLDLDKKDIEENSFETPSGGDTSTIQKTLNSKSYRGASRQKHIFGDLKSLMDGFLGEFNYYFFDEVFTNVVEEIQKLLEEKHVKTLEISKSYNNQIKEYEFLINTDPEGAYKDSLLASIDQLKEELTTELEKVDDEYDLQLKDYKNRFKKQALKENNGIQVIEEKFRLDMFNTISNIIYPKLKQSEKNDKEILKEGKDSQKSDK